jgi:hypothetical protein
MDPEKPLPSSYSIDGTGTSNNVRKTMEDINSIDVMKIDSFKVKLCHHPVYKKYFEVLDMGMRDEAIRLMHEDGQGPLWVLDCSRDQEFPFNVSSLRTKRKPKCRKISVNLSTYVSTRVGTLWNDNIVRQCMEEERAFQSNIPNLKVTDLTFNNYFLEKIQEMKKRETPAPKVRSMRHYDVLYIHVYLLLYGSNISNVSNLQTLCCVISKQFIYMHNILFTYIIGYIYVCIFKIILHLKAILICTKLYKGSNKLYM